MNANMMTCIRIIGREHRDLAKDRQSVARVSGAFLEYSRESVASFASRGYLLPTRLLSIAASLKCLNPAIFIICKKANNIIPIVR
jgi:hypothetical protein